MEQETNNLTLLPETLTRPWFQLQLHPQMAAKMSVKERLQVQRALRTVQAQTEQKLGIVRKPRRLP